MYLWAAGTQPLLSFLIFLGLTLAWVWSWSRLWPARFWSKRRELIPRRPEPFRRVLREYENHEDRRLAVVPGPWRPSRAIGQPVPCAPRGQSPLRVRIRGTRAV